MKILSIIAILTLVISCKEQQNPTLDFLNEGLKQSTESIINFQDDEINKIIAYSYETDLMNNKYKNSFNKSLNKTKLIQKTIDNTRTALGNHNFKVSELKGYSKKLYHELQLYYTFIDSLIETDSVKLPNYIEDKGCSIPKYCDED